MEKILLEVGDLTGNGIQPLINLIAQCFVSFSIIFLLISVNPEVGLTLIVIVASIYFLIFSGVSSLLSNLGEIRLKANKYRFRIVNEAFGGLKVLKSLNLQKYYLDNFSSYAKKYFLSHSLAQSVATIPRYIVEGTAFITLILFCLIQSNRGVPFSTQISLLSLYALGFYKLLPSCQQIYVAFAKLQYITPILNSIYTDFNNLEKPESLLDNKKDLKFNRSFELKNISFKYPNSDIPAIDNLTLKINKFSKVGITGQSGCGKTTLINILLGLIEPDKGEIFIDGKELKNQTK